MLKVLGVWFGIAAAVGNTIAAGIVRAPGDIAQWLPNIYLFFGVWILGGLYALVGASSMAELGAAIPRSGGQYNFSRRAIGDYAGFIVGWSDWLSTCGTAAAVAIVIGEYSGALIPALAGHVQPIAIVVIVGFFVLQWRGISWGKGTQLVTAAMKTIAFLILVAACFLFGGQARNAVPTAAQAASAVHAAAAMPTLQSGWPLAIAFMLALQAVLYTVDGWDGVVYFGEEVRNPGRDVPRAIFGSVFSIMGIYLLINAAVLYVLPLNQVAGNTFSLGTAADRIFGHLGDPIIRSIMVISLLSCMNANQLFCSRTLYAMSLDGLFFRQAAKVNSWRHARVRAVPQHHCRGGVRTRPIRTGHRYALVFLRSELHAHLCVAIYSAQERTANAASLSRLGLPVHDDHRAGGLDSLSDRVDSDRPAQRAVGAAHADRELPGLPGDEIREYERRSKDVKK